MRMQIYNQLINLHFNAFFGRLRPFLFQENSAIRKVMKFFLEQLPYRLVL